MRDRASVVEEVAHWLDSELRQGRFQDGESLPSERHLSRRLRVSRGVIREAKARLQGLGHIEQRRWSSRFRRCDGPSLLRDWIDRSGRSDLTPAQSHRHLFELLELWRLVVPEMVSLAAQRAPSSRLPELKESLRDFESALWLAVSTSSLCDSHRKVLACAAGILGSAPFMALAYGLAAALMHADFWELLILNRLAWKASLDEAAQLAESRKGGAIRRRLRTIATQELKRLRAPPPG